MLFRAIATISGITLISRILGFLRDISIAAVLGAGAMADCFFVAFKLPNFMRRLTAEGAFTSAFVPIFTSKLSQEEADSNSHNEQAKDFVNQSFSVMTLSLLGLVIIFQLFMPAIVTLIAPGFAGDPQKAQLATELARITIPYIIFISLVALLSGVLGAFNKFAAAAMAPIILNICLIISILFLKDYFATPAHALSWGVFVAGVLQFIWMMYAVIRAKWQVKLSLPCWNDNMKLLVRRMIPTAIGAGVAQINLLVDIILASFIVNAVSYLYFADRINQLPIGMIGVAIGTAILPALSRQIQAGDSGKVKNTINDGLLIGMIFAIPSAAAAITIAEPLIAILFEYGEFSKENRIQASYALMAYAVGLPAYIAIKVFIPIFFASGDTKTPVIIAIISMLFNLVLNLLLIGPLAHTGLALATAIAAWLNVVLLYMVIRKRGIYYIELYLWKKFTKLLLAAILMAGLCYYLSDIFADNWQGGALNEKIIFGITIICCSLTSYLVLIRVLAVMSFAELKNKLKKG